MKLRWLTVFLCSVAWRTACGVVPYRQVYNSTTSSSNNFCVTVSDQEPANLTKEERPNWKSSPSIVIQLFVQVSRLNVYVTCASKRQLDKDLLHLGSHDVAYREEVKRNGYMILAVTMDSQELEPQKCTEDIYASSAQFKYIRVFARGPLYFNWTGSCPETTTMAPTTLPSTTTTRAPSTLPSTTPHFSELGDSPLPSSANHDASTLTSHNLVTHVSRSSPLVTVVANTTNSFSVTRSPPTVEGIPFWAWIVAGAVLVVVIAVAVSCGCACARRRQNKNQMKRRTDAERVKQELLVDAKRMSYQEQMRWDMDRVDSGAVQATQEFSYNMTTFSDRA